MNKEELKTLLKEVNACHEAREWAEDKTLSQAWATCTRADWMLWLCGRVAGPPDSPNRRKLVLVAAECAATALHLIDDEETRAICEATIQTCYAYTHGEATLDEVRTAYSAADAAAAADRVKVLADCADIVRAYYPVPPCATKGPR